ncbi:MAG: type I restriction enzyme HsdR N-terminal domain-containing protein [Bacteroidetes bacterium]|nr:type I restriction enzyme HsdR N-terminal domain-containing protein [Bacteroidota bacterium]
MHALNFPAYSLDIREQGQKKFIFDIVRKKLIPLTPEEWVRQHAIHHFVEHYHIAPSTIAVEREIQFNRMKKRFDILVFGGENLPKVIVECKAPEVKISRETIIQIAMYNQTFQCPNLWLTNGLDHFWFIMENGKLKPSVAPETL